MLQYTCTYVILQVVEVAQYGISDPILYLLHEALSFIIIIIIRVVEPMLAVSQCSAYFIKLQFIADA